MTKKKKENLLILHLMLSVTFMEKIYKNLKWMNYLHLNLSVYKLSAGNDLLIYILAFVP